MNSSIAAEGAGTPRNFATTRWSLILTSAVVLCIDLGIERIERYLLRWRPTAA